MEIVYAVRAKDGDIRCIWVLVNLNASVTQTIPVPSQLLPLKALLRA